MYTEPDIQSLYTESDILSIGQDCLDYLRYKNRGGINNEKGNTYDNFFAIYQIALFSQDVIEKQSCLILYSQILTFVDDFIVCKYNDNHLIHYQLKNVKNLQWGNAPKSISDDFNQQYKLNLLKSKSSNLYLVVSKLELQNDLINSIPDELQSYADVLYFSYSPSLIKVIQQTPDFLKAIKYLSAFDDPDPDKIEAVSNVLLGAWCASEKAGGISVMEVIKKAQNTQPSFIRSFSNEYCLDLHLKTILDKISGFSYDLTKGFLHWKYLNIQVGTLSYAIDTDKFRQFQELIIKKNPATFDDLEAFLL